MSFLCLGSVGDLSYKILPKKLTLLRPHAGSGQNNILLNTLLVNMVVGNCLYLAWSNVIPLAIGTRAASFVGSALA